MGVGEGACQTGQDLDDSPDIWSDACSLAQVGPCWAALRSAERCHDSWPTRVAQTATSQMGLRADGTSLFFYCVRCGAHAGWCMCRLSEADLPATAARVFAAAFLEDSIPEQGLAWRERSPVNLFLHRCENVRMHWLQSMLWS